MQNLPKKIKHNRCFRQIKFPVWPETWKCSCGGITSNITCGCGKTRIIIKDEKRKERQEKEKEKMNHFLDKLMSGKYDF